MASGNMKAIKRRIKSVGSTMQITKAMEMVASSKLRRAKQRAEEARPYFKLQEKMMSELIKLYPIDSSFLKTREIRQRLDIVIGGDRGLAGGYNSGMFKKVMAKHRENKANGEPLPKIIAIGKKSIEYFEKREYDIISRYPNLETLDSNDYGDISNTITSLFSSSEIDKVTLYFTEFISSMVQEPVSVPILPLNSSAVRKHINDDDKSSRTKEGEADSENSAKLADVRYDPSPEAVFNRMVPSFLTSVFQCAVNDSYMSEQCARRVAMESASDNAEEMIDTLSLLYNRARQEKITNEINEIVGGTNAL